MTYSKVFMQHVITNVPFHGFFANNNASIQPSSLKIQECQVHVRLKKPLIELQGLSQIELSLIIVMKLQLDFPEIIADALIIGIGLVSV